MTLKSTRTRLLAAFVALAALIGLALSTVASDDGRIKVVVCLCYGHSYFTPIPPELNNLGSITQEITVDPYCAPDGYCYQISQVVDHQLDAIHPDFGTMHLQLDLTDSLPPCSLKSVEFGSGFLFPAEQTVYTAYTATLDDMPGQTFRTMSPIRLRSDTLSEWPAPVMNYTILTDAQFEDIANPGVVAFEIPMAGDPVTVVHGEYPIPTLTEWGIIIFCALLFAWMAWMIVRRRRRATVSI